MPKIITLVTNEEMVKFNEWIKTNPDIVASGKSYFEYFTTEILSREVKDVSSNINIVKWDYDLKRWTALSSDNSIVMKAKTKKEIFDKYNFNHSKRIEKNVYEVK